jgi:hypothetical protein
MQGNCSGAELPGGLELDPPLRSPDQCVLTVQGDFLEIAASDNSLWLAHLYVRMESVAPRNQSTLLAAVSGDLWLTFVSLVGDGYRSRAVDVHEGCNLYARGARR